MFRASETEHQMSLFDDTSDMIFKHVAKQYEDSKSWQNQFYRMVTSEKDESLFQPLFKEGRMGAPNASIRMLVTMSVLKEGFGCSDEKLMGKCDYDLLTRRAFGLNKMEDAYPSIDTYYLFRRCIPNPDTNDWSRWRYFPPGQQELMLFRQHLDGLPQSKRNNVEVTIFQLSYASTAATTKPATEDS